MVSSGGDLCGHCVDGNLYDYLGSRVVESGACSASQSIFLCVPVGVYSPLWNAAAVISRSMD